MQELIGVSESILTSIKKLLGPTEEYEAFDAEIMMHINSVFLTLQQIGVGPDEGFFIIDKTSIWSDFVSNKVLANAVITYMYLKVKLLFDPPASASAIEAINRLINEYEWRINEYVENPSVSVTI